MLRTLALCATIIIALLAAPLDAAARTKPGSPPPAGDRYIVLYDRSVPSADAETDRQERARGFRARHRFRHAVEGFAARLTPEQVRDLRADPDVAFVTPDRPVRALGQVPLAAGEPIAPPGIRRIGAATANSAREASGTGVAVVDTGVDLAHPDLNAVNGVNCVTPGAAANDDNGHGTHVAGTIGARNNGAGVLGVAPATKIYAVKVLDAAGDGSWSSIICGLDWVTANAAALNIKVANMSLGGLGSNDNNCGATDGDAFHQAVCRLTRTGVLSVVAAGNDSADLKQRPGRLDACRGIRPRVVRGSAGQRRGPVARGALKTRYGSPLLVRAPTERRDPLAVAQMPAASRPADGSGAFPADLTLEVDDASDGPVIPRAHGVIASALAS